MANRLVLFVGDATQRGAERRHHGLLLFSHRPKLAVALLQSAVEPALLKDQRSDLALVYLILRAQVLELGALLREELLAYRWRRGKLPQRRALGSYSLCVGQKRLCALVDLHQVRPHLRCVGAGLVARERQRLECRGVGGSKLLELGA